MAASTPGPAPPGFSLRFIDLCQPRLGARVLDTSDDFFAPKERLIKPAEPVFIDGKYDDHGKWMDGWESRRRRDGGHDWCVVLICRGRIEGVDIDTRHFTGNYPPQASLEACRCEGTPGEDTEWSTILPRTELRGDSHNWFEIDSELTWTHVRLNIFPDGGVARLRLYGQAEPDPADLFDGCDLAAMANGGRALACSDMHYGHMSNLIAPGRADNMGDGWETRRRRSGGNDWAIVALGARGRIESVEVDTAYFKGNYPAACALHGALIDDADDHDIANDATYWKPLLERVPLEPDSVHTFQREVLDAGVISHVRLDIYPDGGISRLRLRGRPESLA